MGDATACNEMTGSVDVYIITHWQPCAGGAYGSSPRPTGPQTDGTYFVCPRLAAEGKKNARLGYTYEIILCSFAVLDQTVNQSLYRTSERLIEAASGGGESVPCTCFTDADTGAGKILSKALVVLDQPPELEL